MYKLWRRELAKPITPDNNHRKKESVFSQNLATLIKIARKKEDFYLKAMAHSLRPRTSSITLDHESHSLQVIELQ